MPDTDVLVVGGGPVGLAAAIEARRRGLDVVVLEPREGTVDKACGEGLMPGALALLRAWDVDPPGHPLRGISYRSGAGHVDHLFRGEPGRGVRRTVLHVLAAEAPAQRADDVERALRRLSDDEDDALRRRARKVHAQFRRSRAA